MAPILGFFVAAWRLETYKLVGDAREWFDQIFVDFGPPDSPNHIETLVLCDIAENENTLMTDSQGIPLLDRIRDHLPKFDYLFVSGAPFENLDITDSGARNHHIDFCKSASQVFIDYLRDNNITIPIHWYISPEASLNSFGDPFSDELVDHWKEYISKYTDVMTNLSADNGLNVPEFLWSPFFPRYPSVEPVRELIKVRLNSILTSEPRLRWLHVQDGVGARSKKHSNDGTITYNVTAEDVIRYYNDILVPAAQGTTLKSNCINMEFFVFDDQSPANIWPGDMHEQELRQSTYLQANVPLGVCFEIGYWYGSKYYRIVPDVIGLDTDLAVSTVRSKGFTTVELFGSNLNTKIRKQEPAGGTYLHKDSSVKLTATEIVIVPDVIGNDLFSTKSVIRHRGLVPVPSGGGPVVTSQTPSPDARVPQGSTVKFHLLDTGGQPP